MLAVFCLVTLVNDFASSVATRKEFPSLSLSFKMFDPPILVDDTPAPECVILPGGRPVYSITGIFDFLDHDETLSSSVARD
jgi:hypothetical protein